MRVTTGLALGTALIAALAGCDRVSELKTENQTQQYAERITRVEIELSAGDVTFSPATADGISVSRRVGWRSDKPVVTETFNAGTMHISFRCPKRTRCRVDYDLRVPASASVHARTDAGDITLTGITGDLDLGADSGDVTLEGAAGTVRASADSGDVTATGLRSTDVAAKADSGNVALTFAAAPTAVDARADSGNATITVPHAEGGYAVRAEVDSGKRTVAVDEVASSPRHVVALVDSGNATVRY
jgi:DUF4097 and DUF4098 domain-containing protein YvlB